MPQYLADIKEKEFFIENEEAHHLTVVARRNEGDEIVVFDGKGKQFKVLKYHRKNIKIQTIIILTDIIIVHGNLAFSGVIQTTKELNKGGLSASVHSYDGYLFAYLEFDRYVFKGVKVASWILE